MRRRIIEATVLAVLFVAAVAQAASTDDQKCISRRQKAIAKHQQCQQGALSKPPAAFYLKGDFAKFDKASRTCTVKFAKSWASLQRIPVAPCNLTRFVDNGDGTVTDNLSGLVWEKKDNLDSVDSLSNPHDADNHYSLSAGRPWIGNGTAYTTFLTGGLNTPGFAGANDWRLPTWIELAGIRDIDPKTLGCVQDPCIDAAFGPTDSYVHWSSTTVAFSPDAWLGDFLNFAWLVRFRDGEVNFDTKDDPFSVRAVRGGL